MNVRFWRWSWALLLGWMAFDQARTATADLPVPRDVWYVCESGDQRYGFEHVTVARRDDGNYIYRVESKVRINLLGQKQEIIKNATYVVSPTLEPILLTSEGQQQSGATRATGQIEGDELVLVYEHNTLRRERRIPRAEQPLFVPCLDDWLHHQARETKPLNRRIIDDASLELENATCIRKSADATGTLWDVNLGMELLGQGQVTLDQDGIRRESTYRIPKRHLRRVTAAEVTDITHLVFPASELLMYPVERPLGPMQRVTSLTIRLDWKGAGLDLLHLEDERQKIIGRTQADDTTSMLVRIQPVAEQHDPRPWPIAGDDFQPDLFKAELGEDRFIKPRDPEVAKQARTWIGDEKTAAGAVRAISAGVFKYLQGGTMIAETLSAPEVLQCRQGKCSEHAILFASAARSVGIPTRTVLGMRILHGTWVGHMWNEAYVGRWITVDSTVDEVGSSSSLLKLVDSDTVLGTQPARWAAVDALQVTCVDSSPAPDDIDATLKTGIEGGVYTNAQLACRLTVPDSSWAIEDVTSKQPFSATVIRVKVPDHDDVLIHFVPFEVPLTFTPRVLVGTRAAQFKIRYEEFQVLRDEDYTLQTMQGRLFEFRRKGSNKEGGTMLTTEILWTDGRSMFLLNLIADEKRHAEYAADFFKLLKSFESLRKHGETPK